MKKRLLTLLLALALAVSLALPAAAAQTPVEVSSALELAQAMAEPVPARGRFRSRAAAAEPTRVVAFAPALADGYGADRVLHLAAWQEYVLEFSDAAAAQRALARLRSDPDVTDCFLDEAVTADDTLAGLWDETASRSWGGHEMGLTTLRHQADVLLPAGRRATVAVIDTGAEVSHPLLAGRVSARSYDFADNTADVTDVNGHGRARRRPHARRGGRDGSARVRRRQPLEAVARAHGARVRAGKRRDRRQHEHRLAERHRKGLLLFK